MAAICGHLKPHHIPPLIPATIVARWRNSYAPKTAYNLRSYLKRLCAWLEAHGARELVANLPRLKPAHPRETIATPDELTRLAAAAPPWLRWWLLLCAQLGLRNAEARSVARADFNPTTNTITVRTKGGKPRVLPLSPDLLALLATAPTAEPTRPILWALKGEKDHTQAALYKAWENLKRTANVRPELNPHDLRRTLAENTYMLTRDIRAVQQILGHDSLTSTMHYLAHADPQALRPLLERLWTPKKGAPVQ